MKSEDQGVSPDEGGSRGAGGGQFPPTRWTLVCQARDATEASAHAALSELCAMYWYPLYALARRSGRSPHDAEDATQGFFGELLSKDRLSDVAQEKGKLRTFLCVAMKNFMHNIWRKESAGKRGGGRPHLSIDQEAAEQRYCITPADDLTPDVMFERHWAMTLLKRVADLTEAEYRRKGKAEMFDAMRGFLSMNKPAIPYGEVAAKFGMKENAVAVAAHRMRQSYRENLRREVAQTLLPDESVDDEIAHLVAVLAK